MKRLVIVGGGISGLAAAQGACEAGREVPGGVQVTVLEADASVGGKARTHRDDGWCVEEGPTGFLDNEPVLDRLVDAAGLTKLPANAAAARRFLVRGGRMREIQTHPLKFASAGILGPTGLLRILAEPWIGRRDANAEDESIWQFAARRLGRQAADRLIAPMVLGVFAGDAKKLSLASAFPKMHALEMEHGGLIRGMLAKKRAGRLSGGPAGPGGTLTSFAQGLAALPQRLAERGDFEVRCGARVEAVIADDRGEYQVRVEGDGEALPADAVILAGEPWAMSDLVRECLPALSQELDSIYCPPVAVVALGFGAEAHEHVPTGFGVLIPRGEGYRILGCLWDSYLFDGRSPEPNLLVRCMLGGAVDPEVGDLDQQELIETTCRDLDRLFGWKQRPVYQHVVMWPRAIPQYELGHASRLQRIEETLAGRPGLFVCGNGLHGVAFGKAAASGMTCGEEAARWFARP